MSRVARSAGIESPIIVKEYLLAFDCIRGRSANVTEGTNLTPESHHDPLRRHQLSGRSRAASALCRLEPPGSPHIAGLPRLDGTDLYAFRSYEAGREDYVTLIADYIPFQAPFGGPNFYHLDPQAIYAINIDSNGNA